MPTSSPPWPTCFVHGFLGGPDSWDRVRSMLRPHPHDTSLLLPGHGPTPLPLAPAEGARGRARGAFDLAARSLWRQVEPQKSVLVGYSLGARFALAMALIAPERVSHLILIGGNPGLEGADARRARRQSDARWARLLRARGLEAFLAAWEAQPLFASQRRLDAAVREAQRRGRRAHQAEALAEVLVAWSPGSMPVLSERMARLTCPVDWVVGADDAPYRERAKRMCQQHVGSRAIVVEGAGHNVVLEAPGAVARCIAEAQKSRPEAHGGADSDRL